MTAPRQIDKSLLYPFSALARSPGDCSNFLAMDVNSTSLNRTVVLLRLLSGAWTDTVSEVESLAKDSDFQVLTKEYNAWLEGRKIDLGFNLFALISDVYHKENFHSDVLAAFLDPSGAHEAGALFLNLFVNFLNLHKPGFSTSNYRSATIVREEGKLDILIKDDQSKRAIIVENKINDAGDMRRQIPRYLEYVRERRYKCDAVVYLILSGYKKPDQTDWSEAEIKDVESLLIIVRAYDDTHNNLRQGWIIPAESSSKHPDAQSILRQYGKLIENLGAYAMIKPLMEKLYPIMLKQETYNTALSVNGMLNDLAVFRRDRIIDHFKNALAPFLSIDPWKDYTAYFTGLVWEGSRVGLDINVSLTEYKFAFWERDRPKDKPVSDNMAAKLLKKMDVLDDYNWDVDGISFFKTFKFPEEEQALLTHITEFKLKLADAVKKTSE